MNLKPPLTFEKQIERLMQHGMCIDSIDEDIEFLKRVNYVWTEFSAKTSRNKK